jgi:hypothetical protein
MKKAFKKLGLNAETLRNLSDPSLTRVDGGARTENATVCTTCTHGCSGCQPCA